MTNYEVSFSDNCLECGCQIWLEGGVWVDNSGGDVCGANGDNEPHQASGDEITHLTKTEEN
ncbi:hypothetical protein UFOVP115_93 [uncultured Caudovirales phage]|uniref:Uncharacterized protein n=1 Tax=uncultured Caudovirales phage TaxID=2100421 RepID=A0A6J5L6L0_9CAUD|nr:hypothetical protein UFOVP115_93 [uncultured Caudovirales phage]